MPPQIIPFDFGAEKINIHDMILTTCTANKGDLPIELQWLFNEELITTNDGILISRTSQRISTLSIESVMGRHNGKYTCIASNSAGIVKHSADLIVNGSNKCILIIDLCSCIYIPVSFYISFQILFISRSPNNGFQFWR